MPTPRSSLPPTLRPSSSSASESLNINTTGPGSSYFKRRSFIYAAGFAVITIAGTLIGATLKSRAQAEEKEKKKLVGLREKTQEGDTMGEQIAVLEATRSSLLVRKGQIERKIGEVREREKKEVEMREERRRLRERGMS